MAVRRKRSGKRWMQRVLSKNPGGLHRSLGIPEGEKIPVSMIRAAAKRKGKVGAQARLALVAMRLNPNLKRKRRRSSK